MLKNNSKKEIIYLDLFELHDEILDDKPKKWICAKGKDLENEITRLIQKKVSNNFSKTDLVRHFMRKFKI